MATPNMGSLYKDLQRVFEARPTDLSKTGKLLTELKVQAIQSTVPRFPHKFASDWPSRNWVIPSTRKIRPSGPRRNP